MTKKDDKTDAQNQRDCPQPVDVVDGIPDRAIERPTWRFVLLGAIFALWVAFLIYVAAAGGPS
jgi:hypothetical protein